VSLFPNRTVLLAPLLAAAALLVLVLGCGREAEQRGPAVEREESRGANHYRLRSHVEPHRVTLGDRAVWRLSADLPPSAVPSPPLRDPADSSLDLSVLDPAGASRREGGVRWRYALDARGFTLGPIPLPALRLPVTVGGTIDTLLFPPDTLFVDSLTQAMSGSVQPDRGPLPTELRPIDIAVAVAAALLAIALVVLIVSLIRNAIRRRRRATVIDSSAPPEPPEAILLRELEQLREEASSLPRDRFYERLSLALRGYAAAVTGYPVLDLTTTELTRELGRDGRVDPKGADFLLRALRRSDLAKFARHEDPLAEAREALEEAATLAGRLLRPQPKPDAGPAPPGS
jgi:hypothetical protein